MTLRRRLVVTSFLVSVPVAAGLYFGSEWLRTRERTIAVQRVLTGLMSDSTRAQCEADPQWFLAGPRDARPSLEERAKPDADVLVPRPSTDPLPFEFFPYDEQFAGSSTASPRFPADLKRTLRFSSPSGTATFETPDGTGVQAAALTGWKGGPCAILLARLRPAPHERTTQLTLAGAFFLITFLGAWLVTSETNRRVRLVEHGARESARHNYGSSAPVTGKDEIGSIASLFNEAAVDIRRRMSDVKDREEALRRLVANTTDDVAKPLAALESRLSTLDIATAVSSTARADVRAAIREAHHVNARLRNLNVAAAVRMSIESAARGSVDLASLVKEVVDQRAGLARASDVTLGLTPADRPVVVSADHELLERAVGNLVDNAILYNRPGGRVDVRLDVRGGGFALLVADNGPGVSEAQLERLTAVRRFRGDEARRQQPGDIGLGLALVREIGDRFGLQWTFRRAPAGGFEAELAGATNPH